MRFGIITGILTVLITGAECLAQAPSSTASIDEKSLWDIYKLQQEKPDDHQGLYTACMELAKKAPKDRLSSVLMTMASWHQLKLGNKESAIKLFRTVISMESSDPLGIAAANMSRAWLTRIDMEQVKQALQLCYYKNIIYPKTIDEIKPFQKDGQPPLVDRWNKQWVYSLEESKYAKKAGIATYGQFWSLKSSMLGTNSAMRNVGATALTKALKVSYGAGIALKPAKLLSGTPGKEMVQFETTDGKQARVILTFGVETGGMVLCYAGPKLIILSDMNHWAILPRPN